MRIASAIGLGIAQRMRSRACSSSEDLCESGFVLLEGRTHEQSLRLKTADLVALSEALLADLWRD